MEKKVIQVSVRIIKISVSNKSINVGESAKANIASLHKNIGSPAMLAIQRAKYRSYIVSRNVAKYFGKTLDVASRVNVYLLGLPLGVSLGVNVNDWFGLGDSSVYPVLTWLSTWGGSGLSMKAGAGISNKASEINIFNQRKILEEMEKFEDRNLEDIDFVSMSDDDLISFMFLRNDSTNFILEKLSDNRLNDAIRFAMITFSKDLEKVLDRLGVLDDEELIHALSLNKKQAIDHCVNLYSNGFVDKAIFDQIEFFVGKSLYLYNATPEKDDELKRAYLREGVVFNLFDIEEFDDLDVVVALDKFPKETASIFKVSSKNKDILLRALSNVTSSEDKMALLREYNKRIDKDIVELIGFSDVFIIDFYTELYSKGAIDNSDFIDLEFLVGKSEYLYNAIPDKNDELKRSYLREGVVFNFFEIEGFDDNDAIVALEKFPEFAMQIFEQSTKSKELFLKTLASFKGNENYVKEVIELFAMSEPELYIASLNIDLSGVSLGRGSGIKQLLKMQALDKLCQIDVLKKSSISFYNEIKELFIVDLSKSMLDKEQAIAAYKDLIRLGNLERYQARIIISHRREYVPESTEIVTWDEPYINPETGWGDYRQKEEIRTVEAYYQKIPVYGNVDAGKKVSDSLLAEKRKELTPEVVEMLDILLEKEKTEFPFRR